MNLVKGLVRARATLTLVGKAEAGKARMGGPFLHILCFA